MSEDRSNGTRQSRPTYRLSKHGGWTSLSTNAHKKGFRYTLAELHVLVGLFALVCGLAKWCGSPSLAAMGVTALIAWLMARYAYAHLMAVLFFFFGAELLALQGVAFVYESIDGVEFLLAAAFALIPVSVSIAILMGTAICQKEKRWWQLGNVAFIILLIATWVAILLFVRAHVWQIIRQPPAPRFSATTGRGFTARVDDSCQIQRTAHGVCLLLFLPNTEPNLKECITSRSNGSTATSASGSNSSKRPAEIKPGRVVDDFVSFCDFAPTFLAAAGIKPPKDMTGRSFMNLLTSDKSCWIDPARDKVFVERERHTVCRPNGQSYPVRAIRTKDFFYIRNLRPNLWPIGDPDVFRDCDGSPSKTEILKRRAEPEIAPFFDLSFAKRPEEELFDLKKDPDQIRNVAAEAEYADVKKKLRVELDKWMAEKAAPRAKGETDFFDKVPYQGRRPAQKKPAGKK